MSLEFPFIYARVSGLGVLFYPVVRLQLKTIVGWKEIEFLVDTGADLTTLPQTILPLLGLDTEKLDQGEIRGVGDTSVPVHRLNLPLRLGDTKIFADCWITKDRTTPFLLGRKDIFGEKFSLIVDSKRKVTILRKN